jgi:hypothetical protein
MSDEEKQRKTSVDDGTVDIEVGEGYEEQEVEVDDISDSSEEKAVTAQEDEHEEYSQSVKKRIDRLTKKMREAERQREEALKYAQGVQSEAEKIKAKLNAVDKGYLSEYSGRITAETTAAQEAFKRAIAVGDPEATLEAQKKLTELQFAASKLEEAKRVQARQAPQPQPQLSVCKPVGHRNKSLISNNISLKRNSLSNNISNPRLGQILGRKSGLKRMTGSVMIIR